MWCFLALLSGSANAETEGTFDRDGTRSETVKVTASACPDGIEFGDCRTLLAVRDTLVGSGTALNWTTSLPIEEWTGVEVRRSTGRVVELRLREQGLSGTIPSELGNLSALTYLSLSYNRLTGTIPPQLGNLKRLQELWLDGNGLTGTIPAELGNLPHLQYLSIRHTEITGPIPPELGRLLNLDWLLLDGNKLTGPIPAELGGLASVVTLWLPDNELTGSIPAALGRLSKLQQLLLYNNQLTGSIPRELGRLRNLTDLHLRGNQLTGCVPAPLHDVERNDLQQVDLPICPPASVIDVLIESSPRDGLAYGTGERIQASVWFEADLTVSGSPRLALTIGSGVRAARLVANRGNGGLAFRYVVAPGDRDSDGIGIAPDALSLNGGRIRDVDGEDAVLDLGEHAIANHPSHQVRGALRELVPDQKLEAGGETLTLDLSRHFNVPDDGTLTYGTPVSSDPAVATAIIEEGWLKITPLDAGVATITVTATDDNGVIVTLSFRVTVTATRRGLRPWLMGVLAEQETEKTETADPQ